MLHIPSQIGPYSIQQFQRKVREACYLYSAQDTRTNEIILELRNVCGNGVSNVSFKLNKGELLGIAGLIGAGRTELAKLIFGAARKTSGEIIWKGKSVDFRLPNQAIKEGIYLTLKLSCTPLRLYSFLHIKFSCIFILYSH